jgi:hypothetical protein
MFTVYLRIKFHIPVSIASLDTTTNLEGKENVYTAFMLLFYTL